MLKNLDNWLWKGDEVYTREQRSKNFYEAQDSSKTTFLTVMRALGMLGFFVNEFSYWIINQHQKEDHIFYFVFLTHWGHYSYGIFSMHAFYAWLQKDSLPADSSSFF